MTNDMFIVLEGTIITFGFLIVSATYRPTRWRFWWLGLAMALGWLVIALLVLPAPQSDGEARQPMQGVYLPLDDMAKLESPLSHVSVTPTVDTWVAWKQGWRQEREGLPQEPHCRYSVYGDEGLVIAYSVENFTGTWRETPGLRWGCYE